MAVYKRRWYHNLYLEFHVALPFVSIATRLFRESYEQLVYDICRVEIQVWKWHTGFKLYKKPRF